MSPSAGKVTSLPVRFMERDGGKLHGSRWNRQAINAQSMQAVSKTQVGPATQRRVASYEHCMHSLHGSNASPGPGGPQDIRYPLTSLTAKAHWGSTDPEAPIEAKHEGRRKALSKKTQSHGAATWLPTRVPGHGACGQVDSMCLKWDAMRMASRRCMVEASWLRLSASM